MAFRLLSVRTKATHVTNNFIRDGRYNIDSSTIDILSKFQYFASIVYRSIFPRIDAQPLNIEFRYHSISLMKKRYICTLKAYKF